MFVRVFSFGTPDEFGCGGAPLADGVWEGVPWGTSELRPEDVSGEPDGEWELGAPVGTLGVPLGTSDVVPGGFPEGSEGEGEFELPGGTLGTVVSVESPAGCLADEPGGVLATGLPVGVIKLK